MSQMMVKGKNNFQNSYFYVFLLNELLKVRDSITLTMPMGKNIGQVRFQVHRCFILVCILCLHKMKHERMLTDESKLLISDQLQ